jgi:threonyl-tRNA synthetase
MNTHGSHPSRKTRRPRFSTLDLAGLTVHHVEAAGGGRKDKTRLNKESGPKVAVGVKIGGDFALTKNPPFLKQRLGIFDAIKARRAAEFAAAKEEAVTVTLPDGKEFPATAWKTTPMDIANLISKGLAQNAVVAKLAYSSRCAPPFEGEVCADDGMDGEEGAPEADPASGEGELWDMNRPIEGSCVLRIVKFDDDEGKMVFWHSSAHVLGEVLERLYGSFLTIGPPIANGFYYDSYMGEGHAIHEKDFGDIDAAFQQCVKEKQSFERLIVTKAEALELFAYNPFKSQLIAAKVPEGSRTTVYRNGDLIDLCRGPHLPDTGRLKAFSVLRNSATNWLGDTANDSLQRVYATAFPTRSSSRSSRRT